MFGIDRKECYEPVTILVYNRKKGIVNREISLIALNKANGKVIAAGNDVLPLMDGGDRRVVVLSPLKNGVIADYAAALLMFRHMFRNASLHKTFVKPKITVCVPDDITEMERKAFTEVFYQLGAREVTLSEKLPDQLNGSLPASQRILVGIVRDHTQGQAKSERWEEISRERIPADRYHLDLVSRHESNLTIVLTGAAHRAEVKFRNAAAMRMIAREAVPCELFLEEERNRFKDDHFKNVIYQVDGGEFSGFLSGRGNEGAAPDKHYLIVSADAVLEVLAAGEPEITACTVDPKPQDLCDEC